MLYDQRYAMQTDSDANKSFRSPGSFLGCSVLRGNYTVFFLNGLAFSKADLLHDRQNR